MKEFEDTVFKLQRFILSAAAEVHVTPGELELIELVIRADPLVYAIHLRDFLGKHAAQIEQKDVAALKALLPAQFQHYEIPQPIVDKGFLFMRVFASLFADLDKE